MNDNDKDFRLIAITPEEIYAGEAADITSLLERGWWRVHIRKPGKSAREIVKLISDIPVELRERLSIHNHFEMARGLGVGGVHLNFRAPEPPAGWKGLMSASCHSFAEVAHYLDKCDYMFLSPIFDSISKENYPGRFTAAELAESTLIGPKLFALGGVRIYKLHELRKLGFGGAALLGGAWEVINPADTRLQFITDRLEGVEEVLQGGCRWVQLRMKDASDAEFAAMALPIARLCRRFGAVFILDDRVHLVEPLVADGVHLGKNDMPVAEARRLLGPTKIIGATANTPDDAIAAVMAGADYLGVGPYRFTTTKKNLAPLLGAEGIASVIETIRGAGCRIPVVAIGGIGIDDIPTIRDTGATGIAISGMLRIADNKRLKTREIINVWKNL